MTALEKALQNLKEKSKHFIGQDKTESIVFKQGIDWAIDTIETEIENQKYEEQLRIAEQLENEIDNL